MATFPKINFTSWAVNLSVLAYIKSFQNHHFDQLFIRYLENFENAARKCHFIYNCIGRMPNATQLCLLSLCTDGERAKSFVGRKHYIRQQVTHLIADKEIEQVIILGAGMDGLAIELLELFPALIAIEVDKEQVDAKKQILDKFYPYVQSRLKLLQSDLNERLLETLSCEGIFASHKKTLWIAEGVLMYLSKSVFVRLLSEFSSLAQSQYFLFSTIPELRENILVNPIQSALLNRTSNMLSWRINHLDLQKILASQSWSIIHYATHNQLVEIAEIRNVISTPDPTMGENIYLCEFIRN